MTTATLPALSADELEQVADQLLADADALPSGPEQDRLLTDAEALYERVAVMVAEAVEFGTTEQVVETLVPAAETEAPASQRVGVKGPQLPFADLWHFAWVRSGMPEATTGSSAELGYTMQMFAQDVGHSVKAVGRWAESGDVPEKSADRAAVALGQHPKAVWGNAYYEAFPNDAAELEDFLAAEHLAVMEASMAADVMGD